MDEGIEYTKNKQKCVCRIRNTVRTWDGTRKKNIFRRGNNTRVGPKIQIQVKIKIKIQIKFKLRIELTTRDEEAGLGLARETRVSP